MTDAADERDDCEADRRRLLDLIREWAEEDPDACRRWLGDVADEFLGARPDDAR